MIAVQARRVYQWAWWLEGKGATKRGNGWVGWVEMGWMGLVESALFEVDLT